jgi:hypothetical protein
MSNKCVVVEANSIHEAVLLAQSYVSNPTNILQDYFYEVTSIVSGELVTLKDRLI